jgi:hypothetical protein
MTELKTLKDLPKARKVFNFTEEEFTSDENLKAEAVKFVKELRNIDTKYYRCYNEEENKIGEERDKDFLEKFGFKLPIDDEYDWTDKIIDCLIKMIIHFFNLSEGDLI